MKYIRNREQFRYTDRLVEAAPSNQIYDGTWEDTFVGRFFSFLGRKVVHKMKKGTLNKLLNQMQRELEKAQFKTIESEPLVQKYQVYQNIAIVKSYLKTNSSFSKEEFDSLLENAIQEHTEQMDNETLPMPIRDAHKKVLDGFTEVFEYSKSLNLESISESLSDEGKKKYLEPGEIIGEFMRKPFSGDLKLGKLKLIGNQKGYENNKSKIKDILTQMAKSLSDVVPYIIEKEEKSNVIKLIDSIKGASYDDYVSFANEFDKNIKPLCKSILDSYDKEIRSETEKEKEERKESKKQEQLDKLKEILKNDDSKVYLEWENKGKVSKGYGDKEIMTSLLNDDDTINLERWEEILNDHSDEKIVSMNSPGGTGIAQFNNIVNNGGFIKIGDVEIKQDSNDDETDDETRRLLTEKMDEVFPNDDIYKKEMTISKEEMQDIESKMKTRVEDQKDVVDPIAILRIFNRAYNSFSITKEEYSDLSNKYSPRVASRKKSQYELIENSARDKKLFREWNDGVLNMLQQYGDLISKSTKKFIITMLDNNKLFGNTGAQAKLLSEYFDVPLDKVKDGMKDTKTPASHRVILTEDKTISFISVNDIEMNTDKIRRIPFILEIINERDERKKMTVFPLSANKGRESSSLNVKYSSGDDYGFIKNYMLGINVDFDNDSLLKMGMNDNDNSSVYSGKFLSDNGRLEKRKSYKLSEIHRVIDDKGFDDQRVEVMEIYMLLGSKDEGMYRLPSLNDEMKKAINASQNDKLI